MGIAMMPNEITAPNAVIALGLQSGYNRPGVGEFGR
jgi:hypothetical protein